MSGLGEFAQRRLAEQFQQPGFSEPRRNLLDTIRVIGEALKGSKQEVLRELLLELALGLTLGVPKIDPEAADPILEMIHAHSDPAKLPGHEHKKHRHDAIPPHFGEKLAHTGLTYLVVRLYQEEKNHQEHREQGDELAQVFKTPELLAFARRNLPPIVEKMEASRDARLNMYRAQGLTTIPQSLADITTVDMHEATTLVNQFWQAFQHEDVPELPLRHGHHHGRRLFGEKGYPVSHAVYEALTDPNHAEENRQLKEIAMEGALKLVGEFIPHEILKLTQRIQEHEIPFYRAASRGIRDAAFATVGDVAENVLRNIIDGALDVNRFPLVEDTLNILGSWEAEVLFVLAALTAIGVTQGIPFWKNRRSIHNLRGELRTLLFDVSEVVQEVAGYLDGNRHALHPLYQQQSQENRHTLRLFHIS